MQIEPLSCFSTCILTPAQIAEFDEEPTTINWGVLKDGVPVVMFSALPCPADSFEVHIHAKRRAVHPQTLVLMAEAMIARMFELGAKMLTAEIAPTNKACLRLAQKVGFEIVETQPEWVILRRKR